MHDGNAITFHLEVSVGAVEVGSFCKGFEGIFLLQLQDTEGSGH